VITRAYSEYWLGTSLDRKKLTQALPSLPETADELEAVAAKLGDSAYRRRTPYKKLYGRDEFSAGRALLSLGNPKRRPGGVGILSSSTSARHCGQSTSAGSIIQSLFHTGSSLSTGLFEDDELGSHVSFLESLVLG
jgi:hypothetical protein